MPNYSYNDDLKVISRRLEFYLALVWPVLLIVTWFLLSAIARNIGVFHNIPEELRQGIFRTDPRGVPGFVQDPFYTIWQFFWIPFVLASIYAFRMVPKMVRYFINLANKDSTEVIIPEGFKEFFNRFRKYLHAKWHWYVAVGGGVLAILLQLNTQFSRIKDMDIMYWWDWRINKTIYIVRLIMVGVDIFFAVIIVYRGVWSIIFIRRFLRFIKLTPRPLHPDRAGGLGIVGKICLSFTWPLLVFGIILATSFFFHEETEYFILNIISLSVYIICITVVFFFPLSSVHKTMKKAKEEWLDKISLEIRKLLIKLEQKLKAGQEDHDSCFTKLDHLKQYYDTVHSMPVWPYDFKTISRFFTSILIPIVMFIIHVIAETLIK